MFYFILPRVSFSSFFFIFLPRSFNRIVIIAIFLVCITYYNISVNIKYTKYNTTDVVFYVIVLVRIYTNAHII